MSKISVGSGSRSRFPLWLISSNKADTLRILMASDMMMNVGVSNSGNSPSRSVSHKNRDGVESTDALSLLSSSSHSVIREIRDAGGVGEVGI